jgi:hypothetical protein
VSAGAAASDGKPADPDYIARDLVEAARIIDQLSDASSAGVAAKRGA